MFRRSKTFSGLAAALVALALGGSSIASAAHHHGKRAAHETTTGPDTDSIESGDQTSPDSKGAKGARHASQASEEESQTPGDGPGGHEDPEGDVENEE
jgi:hypothetical protein